MKSTKFIAILLIFVFQVVSADLRTGFYDSACPNAEKIVRQVVEKRFATDKSIPAALLRMHFHDCFVRGCDASILIDSTKSKPSEKTAGPNQSVRGFELIDEAKNLLEAQCPSTVSCADIITLATRDAVALAGGPSYPVPTGRRDGLVSKSNDVNLPGPTFSVSMALQSFKSKNLDLNDMTTLLGAHTVGIAHCSLFSDRLSDFQGTGKPDPSMDPALVSNLSSICSKTNDPTAFLDQNTSFAFDNQFYVQIQAKRGILQLDQELASDGSTRGIVSGFASNNEAFKKRFAEAMVKMGSIEVLLGNAGEIRKNCRVFNGPASSPSPSPRPGPAPTPSPSPKPAPSPAPSPRPAPVPGPIPRPRPRSKPGPRPRPHPKRKTGPKKPGKPGKSHQSKSKVKRKPPM
ncbi:PREDICTED: peroxidase 57-like [Tarenaya hassleriana]|uniref:peroxidase 57-like n=1 Tax=Tarenaya hassleriana TaxID=28532 RepID=UPI00053C6FFF|nr:PREDICTED: peroxidase 57-like [Tarenaya hassleriana]